MSIGTVAVLFVVCFFATTLACLEVGRALGRRALATLRKPPAGLGTVESVVFALLGLLLALTFTSAATRFETRRGLAAEEGNAIGTAWLRLDLLPEDTRPKVRQNFRTYADARIASERALPDVVLAQRKENEAAKLQQEIWTDAVAGCARTDPQTKLLVLPALNTMIDITGTRGAALRAHLPLIIYGFLWAMSMVSGLFAGYEMGRSAAQSPLHTVGFALLLACTVYLILDFEYPRLGLIRVDDADRALVQARRAMD